MKTMRMHMLAALAAILSMPMLAVDFDWRGRVDFAWGPDKLFNGENYTLLEAHGDGTLDAIDWRCTAAPSPLDNSLTLTGVNGRFSIRNLVERIDGGCVVKFEISVKDADGSRVFIDMVVPGETLSFIPEGDDRIVEEFDKDGRMVITGPFYEYQLELDGSVGAVESANLRDARGTEWGKDSFRLQIRTAPIYAGRVKLSLKVTRRLSPALAEDNSESPFMMIPLDGYFTRPLVDEVENDGKGGWVDQGPNDMSCLKPGVIQAQAIPFQIGDGAIILYGTERKSFPRESKVIPVNEKAERIAFCHTSAWCDSMRVGFTYRIAYDDGTSVDVPVHGGLDVADWAGALPPSARVKSAWEGANNEHQVHLAHFQWKNPNPEKIVKSIQVISAGVATIPAVLAITVVRQDQATDQLVSVLNNEYSEASIQSFALKREKTDWYEGGLDASQTIESGSALDVSFVLHQPAGKYGFVKKVGNHFEFERLPGQRIAFWGTNIGTAGPRREFVPVIVDRLKKSGINIVRIHRWMSDFYHPQCPEENARAFIRRDGTVDMQRLDDFYYFFAELKKNGIYVYMDTIASYNDWLPGGNELHYRPDANARIKEIARLMYTTTNPYTGLALVDDPAFAMCEIHNEFSATYQGTVEGHSPEARELMQEKWKKWKADHGIADSSQLKGGPVEGNGEEGRRFYTSIQKDFLDDWYGYLRELGVKVPISGTNLLLTAGDLLSSQGMDFTEDHAYCGAAPTGGGWWSPLNTSTVNGPLRGNPQIGEIIHSRLHDKPVVCTEWSDVYPHPYRMEGYPIFGAFAAYQAIDGMFSFDWGGSYMSNITDGLNHGPIVCLSQISDPCTWGLNQAVGLAFLRGDIAPAKNKVVLKYTYDDIWQNRRQKPLNIAYMFQMAQVSIQLQTGRNSQDQWPFTMSGEDLYHDAVQRLGIDAGRDYIISDTGQLKRFTEPGLFLVDTPRSQFAVGALDSLGKSPKRKLSAFEVNSSMSFATISFSSLDGEALSQSSRILLCAVGEAYNADSYTDEKGYHEGAKCPILCEPFYATITANAVPGKQLKVYRLEPSTGRRLGQLAVTANDGKDSFILDKDTKTMYLELLRE